MRKRKKQDMNENDVKVIKISKEALFEFIYEQFIANEELFLDVSPLDVSNSFEMDWENGQFIFCAHKSEDLNGNYISFPKEIDLQKVMKNIPDTTSTILSANRFRKYTKGELIELSK
jgi:hypothetical protein